jgi:hypothetical protein
LGRETAMILPRGSSSNTGTDFGSRNDTDDIAPAAPHVPLPFVLGFLCPLPRSLCLLASIRRHS